MRVTLWDNCSMRGLTCVTLEKSPQPEKTGTSVFQFLLWHALENKIIGESCHSLNGVRLQTILYLKRGFMHSRIYKSFNSTWNFTSPILSSLTLNDFIFHISLHSSSSWSHGNRKKKKKITDIDDPFLCGIHIVFLSEQVHMECKVKLNE